MRKIIKPSVYIRQIVTDCISNMSDLKLKTEIECAIHLIEVANTEYNLKKASNELHHLVRGQEINSIVTSKVLKDLYSKRFINKNNLARKHYDNLLFSAPNGRCPQCGIRIATTLDHNLPKSKYALLSVSAFNLIPSCTDCNKVKHVSFPRSAEEESIHPYYDDIENIKWLHCKVINVKPLLIEYYVSTESMVPKLLNKRIKNHFDSFNLNDLYVTHGIEEFSNIQKQLINLFNSGGSMLLLEHLKEGFDSRSEININSWQTAFYETLLNDKNFTNGLFI